MALLATESSDAEPQKSFGLQETLVTGTKFCLALEERLSKADVKD